MDRNRPEEAHADNLFSSDSADTVSAMPYQREVRLGIVLYGGVSLAVYENGVAQELYRAIRGDGVYGLLKDLIDSEIVVDIISGTSAGGVNGIMLAHSLANKRSFAASADLWRKQ